MEAQLYGRLTCAPSIGCLSISQSRFSEAWLTIGELWLVLDNNSFIVKLKVATFDCVNNRFKVRY